MSHIKPIRNKNGEITSLEVCLNDKPIEPDSIPWLGNTIRTLGCFLAAELEKKERENKIKVEWKETDERIKARK